MERSVKRDTPTINRANFENARKILFGRTIIPGTDRERWTTAGTFIPGESTNTDFQLGKFTFTLDNRAIRLDGVKIAEIYSDRLITYIEYIYYRPKLDSNVPNNTRLLNTFLKDDKLYINYNIISYGGSDTIEEGLWRNVSDIESAKERYFETKKSILNKYRDENIAIEITYNKQLLVKINPDEFKEGIFRKGDALIMISQGFPGLKLSVSTTIQPDVNSKKFKTNDNDESLIEIKHDEIKTFVAFKSDFDYFNEAISWLMHVLTGPDPRTFKSPLPNRILIDQLKESTEPKKKVYGKQLLVFFAGAKKETRESFDLYYKTLLHLQNFQKKNYDGERQPANFADNYATFIYGDDESEIVKKSPMPPEEFKKALERLKQYEQHEFTGNMLDFHPF